MENVIAMNKSTWIGLGFIPEIQQVDDYYNKHFSGNLGFFAKVIVIFPIPIALTVLWLRTMPARSEFLTVILCGLPAAASICIAVACWRFMSVQRDGAIAAFSTKYLSKKVGISIFLALFSIFGWIRTEGTLERYAGYVLPFYTGKLPDYDIDGNKIFPFWNDFFNAEVFPDLWARANLENAKFVDMPSNLKAFGDAIAEFR